VKREVSIFWKKTPFLKIFLATSLGILLEWYLQPAFILWICLFCFGLISLILFSFSSLFTKFKFNVVSGIAVTCIFSALGAWLITKHDIRKDNQWFALNQPAFLILSVDEPLSEKPKTFKTIANVEYAIIGSEFIPCNGKIILYFKKDSLINLSYGSLIILYKKPEEIKNFVAGFNYKRYCVFKGITHQVFLKGSDFEILPGNKSNILKKQIIDWRERILFILKKTIPGKKELGLAEALLIGYKDDLDKTLVASYTNTGVVHIIAISGLHLGLIYLLLSGLTKKLTATKIKWARPVIIITCLWIFSLMAGAQPSILRSAIMFTAIVIAESLKRKTSVYNSLAVSAFFILCIDPFALWDVGFQLSYSAVLGIVIFMRPVYNSIYTSNKLLDNIWKLNAVTIAAQILTVPLCIYHFNQFPNLFLITNFIAVPLSTIILFAEILLVVSSVITPVACLLGKIVSLLIEFMNGYIEDISRLPFAISRNLYLGIPAVITLYLVIIFLSYWLLEKKAAALKFALAAICVFLLISLHKLPL
jgi:competence protein ComEC